MDRKLQREAPEFKRCCFCLPLRQGLIGWGYARLVLDILVIFYLAIILITIEARFNGLRNTLSFITILSFFIIDVAFTVLHVIAGHKKNIKLMRISYLYSIGWVILVLALGIFGVSTDISRIYSTWQHYVSHNFLIFELVMNCALLFTIIIVQVYVILLTRSEAIKLKNQSLEMQFVNNAAEAEARCISVVQGCTDNGHTLQYTEDEQDSSSSGKSSNNVHHSSKQQEPIRNGNKSDISE